MSYETFAKIRELIEAEQKRLENRYLGATSFLSNEDVSYKPGRKSPLEKIYRNYMSQSNELEKTMEIFRKTVAESYRNHPDAELRKFWGIE